MSKKNVKKMSSLQTRNTASEVLGFTYPKLHEGKIWYVDFYAHDPVMGTMRRKKYMLTDIPTKAEKRKRAVEIMEALMKQLRSGWNPWVSAEERRGFTLFYDVMDRYLEYVDKKDRKKTRHSYHSRINVLQEYISTLVLPIKYAYQFDIAFVSDFLDWIYLDRASSERTRNNYRGWTYSFAEFLIQRKYIKENPVEHIPILKENQKIRKDLTPKMLNQLWKHLRTTDPHFLLACQMQYFTLIRPTELSFLKVGDISVKEQTVFVSGQFSKNHQDAKVGLNDTIIKLMIKLGTLSKPSSFYLFGRGFVPREKRSNGDLFNRKWKKVREELNWPECYQFYSLKDSGIRDLANAEGAVVARDQARHHDITTTNRYIQRDNLAVHAETKQFKGNFGGFDDEEEVSQ